MKILIVSDQIDPFIYNYAIKEMFEHIDCILCAGDLPMDYIDFIVSTLNKPTYFVFGNHNLNDYKYYHPDVQKNPTEIWEKANPCGAVYAGFKNIVSKELKWKHPARSKETPLLITGISGCRNYNHGLCQFTEFEMKLKLLKLIPRLILNKILYGRFVDIFLTHATPRHVHDHEDNCHKGFKSFNTFVKKFKPIYNVHGHIHLYDQSEPRISVYEKTIVVNAFGHYVIDLPVTNLSEIQIVSE